MRCQSLALSYVTPVQGFELWALRCQGAWYHWSSAHNTVRWLGTWPHAEHWMVLAVYEEMKSVRKSPHLPLQMSVSGLQEKDKLENLQLGIDCVKFLD